MNFKDLEESGRGIICYSNKYLDRLRKNYSRSPDQDLKPEPPKYKAGRYVFSSFVLFLLVTPLHVPQALLEAAAIPPHPHIRRLHMTNPRENTGS